MPRTKEQFEEIRLKTRRKILESALELFAQKGFKGTSISDIAKAANISKGLAYNYFNTKNELMHSVFRLLTDELEILFVDMEKLDDPKKKIKLMINKTLKMLQQDDKMWKLYFNFVLMPELHDDAYRILSKFLEGVFTELANIFKEMGIENPKEESKTFAAILDGVCFHYMFDTENYPIEKMRKYLIKKYC